MENIDTKITNLIEEIKTVFTTEKTAIEMARQKAVAEKKDKLLLDEKEQALIGKDKELTKREIALEVNIKKNRERTAMLELREKRMDEEKARLQNIMNSI